jgi:hypothetical protein
MSRDNRYLSRSNIRMFMINLKIYLFFEFYIRFLFFPNSMFVKNNLDKRIGNKMMEVLTYLYKDSSYMIDNRETYFWNLIFLIK